MEIKYQRAADVAAVEAVKAKLLSDTTVLGVTGTLDLDALLETLGYAPGKLTMTINSTTNVTPVFTAELLVGANDFLWIAPNGTSFVGKAPAGSNFVTGGVGTYRLYCTDWTKVTTFACAESNVTALDIAVATALTAIDCDPGALTTLDISANPLLSFLTLSNNALTIAAVSQILVDLAAAAVNGGTAILGGQTPAAIPNAAGQAAILTLEGRTPAWTVAVDEAP